MIKDLFWLWRFRGKTNTHMRDLISIPLGSDDIVIDCGANVGEITKLLSRNGSKVYAFEPNPYAFKILESKFADDKNVVCIQAGLHTENGRKNLFLHQMADDDQVLWSVGSSLLKSKNNISQSNFVEIDCIDFCEFILKIGKQIRLIKMDIEGAECDIILAMIKMGLIRKVDYMFIERHDNKIPDLGEKMDEIQNYLRTNDLDNIKFDWI